MLDLNFIKENRDKVLAAIKSRKLAVSVDLDLFLQDYDLYLDLLRNAETHRGLRNKISEAISKVSPEEKEKLLVEASQLKTELQKIESDLAVAKEKLDEVWQYIPNINSEKMPIGVSEQDNVVVKAWIPGKGYVKEDLGSYENHLYMPTLDFAYKDHVELGINLDVIDVEQSAKVSGSRFCYIKNELALVQDAISIILKRKLLEMSFTPLIPPLLVREKSLFGTSHFPEGREQVYKIENSNVEEGSELYLIGSSEPANFSYFMDKVLDLSRLPIKLYAQTPCFRSEVGSWGKDVRGIKRVHQFDKLEMNAVCAEGQDEKIFEEFLSINEWLFQQLEIPYRVINKCTGDCGYSASYYQYDVEAWRPGVKEFMEVGTDTMTTDYQARRLNIKYKDSDGKMKYARTVNDTGVAFGRALISILENHQNKDGSVGIPKALVPYTGFDRILPKDFK